MMKPYDLKDLGQKIKDRANAGGLALAEEAVELLATSAYLALKDWAIESAVMSENKVDDLCAQFYNLADPYVIPQIKKIDLNKDKI